MLKFVLTLFVIAKIVFNLRSLYENKVFALYFFILLCGTILAGCAQVYSLTINEAAGFFATQVANDNINSIEVCGFVLIDAFLGLMPNLFYSVYQTKLTKATGNITVTYFILNGIIMAGFFVTSVLAMTLGGTNQAVATVIVVMVEYLYGFSFHILVVYKLRDMEGKIQKVMRKFFFYYACYGAFLVIRNSTILYSQAYIHNPQTIWNDIWVGNVFDCAQVTVVIQYLKDIKFNPKEGKSSGSGSGSGSSKRSTTPKETGSNQ